VAASTSQTTSSGTAAGKTRAVVAGGVVVVAVLVSLRAGVAGGAVTEVAETRSSATADVLGNTLELVVTLLASAEDTALGLELVHGHGWQSSALVVCSGVVVNLVDGDSGVDDVGLDDLLVDDGLDGLVDVLEICKSMSWHR
jgi:hypothetical protein